MAVYKNKASQKIAVFAVDSTGAAKTGDAANITARISKDGAAVAQTDDVNPTELNATYAQGVYLFDITQTESNADLIVLTAASSTSGVVLRPVIVYTEPEIRSADAVSISGDSTAADNLEAACDGNTYNLGGGAVVAASVTGAVGSVTGAVGSVTGAVGSVTGNVGGNVAGSVASVTGNVGGNVVGSVGSVTAEVSADVVKISGDATAADNLELQFDGTGISGDAYPATQAQVGNIASTGAPYYQAAASFTKTTGGAETGTYANTDTANGTYHQVADSGGTLDVYYEYTLRPDEVATDVVFKGRMTSAGDNATAQAYDWAGAAWVNLFTLTGTGTTTDTTSTPVLVGKYTGTAAPNVGKVRVRFYGTGLTSANLYVDQCVVGVANTARTVGYSNGSIWIDSTNGTAGTTNYYNGTADHPVSTWADAVTIATSLGFYRFNIAPGTEIAPSADCKKYALTGKGWKLALGGHDYSYATIEGCEYVSGIAVAADWEMFFYNCHMIACSLGEADLHNCHLMDTITLTAAVAYLFNGCIGVPVGTSGITFANAAATAVVGQAKGVWTIAGMVAGNTLYFDGDCDLTLAASCTGGTVYISGNVRLTNSGSGQTIYDSGRWGEDQTLTVLANAIDAVDNYIDTEVAAIKAKTDQLTFTEANKVDANASVALTDEDIAEIAAAASITVTPLHSSLQTALFSSAGASIRDLSLAQNSQTTLVFAITDTNGTAVDLSAKSFIFVIHTDTGTTVYTISATITVGGVSNNQVSVPITSTQTGTVAAYEYKLWNTTDKILLATGGFNVTLAPIS